MRNALRIAPILLLLALLGGCASTPEASRESDADAKRFEPALRAAIVYLYRADIRGGISTIWVDKHLVGQTLAATYFRVAVRPGHNVIVASGHDQGRIEIDTKEEGVYFVEMRVFGESEGASTTTFRSVPPETGKEVIARCCTMLETWRPGQSRFNM